MALAEISQSDLDKAKIIANEGTVFRQEYSSEPKPIGVEVIKTPVFYDEYGGHFLENARFIEGSIKALQEKGINLSMENGQSNTAYIASGTERFGHVHRDQDELWVVVGGTLTVALCDLRKGSSTEDLKTRLVLHEGMGVRIPPGVAHGFGNYTNEVAVLTYYTTMQFSPEKETQEWRFSGGYLGDKFWDFARPEKI